MKDYEGRKTDDTQMFLLWSSSNLGSVSHALTNKAWLVFFIRSLYDQAVNTIKMRR